MSKAPRAVFASYGNDSIALIQWHVDNGYTDVRVVYSDTGWAMREWHHRVVAAEKWVASLGYTAARTKSIGMLGLVEQRHAWPRGGGGKYQFCTEVLKKEPARAWLSEVDPEGDLICAVGIRREESDNRTNFPEWTEESENHGGRQLHAPLVRHREADRDALIAKTPFEVLPYRSKECYPCVNARKHEIASLPENRVQLIRLYERHMGINSKGNPIVMFSPKRHKGAVGIDAVHEWAGGNFDEPAPLSSCDGGWCGA